MQEASTCTGALCGTGWNGHLCLLNGGLVKMPGMAKHYNPPSFPDSPPPDPQAFRKVWFQYVWPKKMVTAWLGRLARLKGGALTTAAIRAFIKRYRVNMEEAANPNPQAYESFNAFFTRPLREGARPLAQAPWICPVDGAISQLGPIQRDHIFQAKGHRYTATALLGGNAARAKPFEHGHFATLYLSPKDYHRIHMPCDGSLRQMIYIPGDLFSVNPTTAQGVPGLFARNERLVNLFDTPHGPMALVLVGATVVGSMATTWHGVVNPPRTRQIRDWHYSPGQVELRQGDEMGRFLLGSTVVLLWPAKTIEFNPAWLPSQSIRLGESMGSVPTTPEPTAVPPG
jgi:phosphatidylserine decarboxylase